MDGEAWQEVGAQIETGIMGDLQTLLDKEAVLDWMMPYRGRILSGIEIYLWNPVTDDSEYFDIDYDQSNPFAESAEWVRNQEAQS